ncbi:MAG: hypothetical protein LBC03_04600, partial [Nitrososphaerota archaeon]|nr:hypothetical protein [Nitrososphaerota archaeon]
MRTLKVAFVTTIPTDVVPAISAVKTINEKTPCTVELCIRAGGDFRDFGALDDFIELSKKSHVVIV